LKISKCWKWGVPSIVILGAAGAILYGAIAAFHASSQWDQNFKDLQNFIRSQCGNYLNKAVKGCVSSYPLNGTAECKLACDTYNSDIIDETGTGYNVAGIMAIIWGVLPFGISGLCCSMKLINTMSEDARVEVPANLRNRISNLLTNFKQ